MEERIEREQVNREIVEQVRRQLYPEEQYQDLAALLKLFGDGTRVQIMHALEQSELCVNDLAELLGVTKSAISHQLSQLRLARLVRCRRDGQQVFYSLADDHVKLILDMGFEHLFE